MKPFEKHAHLKLRRTRIVATIGPVSSSEEKIAELIVAGVNVFRVNFSHGAAEEHIDTMHRIRRVSESLEKTVAILGDLCGPKIRVGHFAGGRVELKDGATVIITPEDVEGTETLIPSQYREIAHDVRPGEPVLLDDGNLELVVTRVLNNQVEARVIHGGTLKDKKGMNLPGTAMSVNALTDKDRSDALAMIRGDADYIALSFVQKAEDIRSLKQLLADNGSDIPVIAKIEKPEALENIEDILDAADGIMVARGDLGVELPAQRVPIIEKELIALANDFAKPVIVATQMLESMIENARPTRAEVTDVAFACAAGADAVMLSAETAVGKFPIDTVKMMDSILREVEARQFHRQGFQKERDENRGRSEQTDAISEAAALIARTLKVRAVIALAESGLTARIASSDRPAAPLIALCRDIHISRRLTLFWGIFPYLIQDQLRFKDYVQCANDLVQKLALAERGQCILLLSGVAAKGVNAGTNAIYLHQVE